LGLSSFQTLMFYILIIPMIIVVLVIYHKMFDVYYFGSKGCVTEIMVGGLIGVILAFLITKFWYISIPVAILFVVALAKGD